MIVLAAMMFGQFATVSHAHDAHDEQPVACDVCTAAVSEDEEIAADLDYAPQLIALSLDAIPDALTLQDAPSVPTFGLARTGFVPPDNARAQPRQTLAPPR